MGIKDDDNIIENTSMHSNDVQTNNCIKETKTIKDDDNMKTSLYVSKHFLIYT